MNSSHDVPSLLMYEAWLLLTSETELPSPSATTPGSGIICILSTHVNEEEEGIDMVVVGAMDTSGIMCRVRRKRHFGGGVFIGVGIKFTWPSTIHRDNTTTMELQTRDDLLHTFSRRRRQLGNPHLAFSRVINSCLIATPTPTPS